MFPLLASWIEFAGMPMEAPLYGSLRELLTEDTREAKNCKEHIREYNLAVAFASMGAEIESPAGSGPYCFRIHGQIYNLVSPIYPKQISQDMKNFIGLKTNQTKGVWLK
jgi:hypothetical protein